QAYVALSRCPTWNNVEVFHLDRSIFNADQNPHTSDLDGEHNNINSHDNQQILKLTESPLQEQNLSAPKNYIYDCVATRECICELVGEWKPCGTVN
ncbi:46282_t:CDS:2, partial [Gigaspora margarita]